MREREIERKAFIMKDIRCISSEIKIEQKRENNEISFTVYSCIGNGTHNTLLEWEYSYFLDLYCCLVDYKSCIKLCANSNKSYNALLQIEHKFTT